MLHPRPASSILVRILLVLLTFAQASLATAAAGGPGGGGTGPPPPPPPPIQYTTDLDASHDLGDLGPIWMRELGVETPSTIWFRWRHNGLWETRARYELRDASNGLVTSGISATPEDAEGYRHFSLYFSDVSGAPYTVHVFPQDSSGSSVGPASNAVILNEAIPNDPTCFTGAGLGLPIRDQLNAIRTQHNVPALAGAITHAGSMAVFDAVGVRSTDSQIPVTAHDKWHMGSITKSMTSTLLAILVQKYPFSVQPGTRISDVFSDEPWYHELEPLFRDISLAELVAQRGGIVFHPSAANAALGNTNLSLIQRRREYTRHLGQAPVWDPNASGWFSGEIFFYHNGNFVVAAAMLEKIFGQTWEDLITQHLFQPLGMINTGFGTGALDGVNHPAGHDGNNSFQVNTGDNVPGLGPAGTVHTTLVDLAKFARLHITGSEGSLTLTQATFDMLHSPWPTGLRYNWGFDNQPVGSGVQLWHNGSNLLWYAELLIRPDEGFALMAATNIERLQSDPDTDGDGELNPRGPRAVADAMAMLMDHQTACPEDGRSEVTNALGGAGLGGTFGPLRGQRDADSDGEVMVGTHAGGESGGEDILWMPASETRSAVICDDGSVYSEEEFRSLVSNPNSLPDLGECAPANEVEVLGAALGGDVQISAGGVTAWVVTEPGESPSSVAQLLANALNRARSGANAEYPTVRAVAIGGRVITPGRVDGIWTADVGMKFVPEPGAVAMTAFGVVGLAVLAARRRQRD